MGRSGKKFREQDRRKQQARNDKRRWLLEQTNKQRKAA
jgi:hypothetical protein